ncbi:MAG: Eco57I restriction-modification methylase domain-containing protein, partial [Nitrosopumilus sp.]
VIEQLSLLDEEERYRINAFDWEAEFPEIIKRGGFDAVIGNPPYIAFQEGSRKVKEYYKRYKSAIGKYDQYILFVEKSLSLTQTNGYFGFIIPNKFVHSDYG